MQKSREGWIIDASVAAKWYLRDEPLTTEADFIKGRLDEGAILGAAPHVSRHEVASLLSTACWTGRIVKQVALREFTNYLETGLSMETDPEWLLHHAANIAIDLRIALYDSVYLALATRFDMHFVTADRKLHDAVGHKLPFVHWLGDIPI